MNSLLICPTTKKLDALRLHSHKPHTSTYVCWQSLWHESQPNAIVELQMAANVVVFGHVCSCIHVSQLGSRHDLLQQLKASVSGTPQACRSALQHICMLDVPAQLCLHNILAGKQIGTTKRGIGPAYASKATRNGLRIVDLRGQSCLCR